jgi:hypothetical protein
MSEHKPRDAASSEPVAVPPPVPRIGALPAGLEEPPRLNPPNPQHPEIPQTHDPRVSVQLERAARDTASGHPGLAAREDLDRFTPDPRRGAGPQPLAPHAGQTEAAEPIVRETPVTFSEQFASYFAGEVAAFTEDEAARLAELGVAGPGVGAATEAPVNVDVPHVQQDDATLTCTMGNWQGEPTGYAYQWQRDGTDIGDGTTPYTVTPADVGTTVTCIVTATNAHGSSTAPPSNGVVVTEPPAGDALHETRRHGR